MRYTPRPDCQIPRLADIYEEHLGDEIGFFVEVGAFDGMTVSNTVFLAEAGWRGLYIEPHPAFARSCRVNHVDHPNITVLETAISDSEGETYLFEIGECSTLVWDKSAVDWGGSVDRKVKVPVTTLDKALEESGVKPGFHLLVIDVEQNELNVLNPFNISKWSPKLVIVEAHEKDPAPERNWKAGPIDAYFSQHGYRKIYSDHINSIYLRG
jgi:FkbM family methyltransferase